MTEENKLMTVLSMIDQMKTLLAGNDYESFLYQHLIQMQVEIQRQLTNLKASSKL